MSTSGSLLVYLGHALGMLVLGLARPDAAVAAMAALPDHVRDHGLGDPAVVPWRPDHVEALARTDRTREAWRELAVLGEEADRSGGAWGRAVTSRCRGLLDRAEGERHFREALSWRARVPAMVFERARTELCFGAWLRRAGRRRRTAADILETARAAFAGMGARGWAGQAEAELAAVGRRVPRGPAVSVGRELTAREHQVAVAVSEGLTNRDAGARLFVSEKAVERHLGAVYRKLCLRSRTQLARAFAVAPGPAVLAAPQPSALATSARPESSTGSRG